MVFWIVGSHWISLDIIGSHWMLGFDTPSNKNKGKRGELIAATVRTLWASKAHCKLSEAWKSSRVNCKPAWVCSAWNKLQDASEHQVEPSVSSCWRNRASFVSGRQSRAKDQHRSNICNNYRKQRQNKANKSAPNMSEQHIFHAPKLPSMEPPEDDARIHCAVPAG